jgi:hypothetical protein
MGAGIAWQLGVLFTRRPAAYLNPTARLSLFRAAIVVEALVIALGIAQSLGARRSIGIAGKSAVVRLWFPALLAVHLLAGVWLIRASPSPRIDTVVVHRAAIRALQHARDPYRITFENIYGSNSGFYNPRVLVGGRVAFGYPYPPVSLLLAVPGQVLAGDYRYAELAALLAGVAFIGYLGPALSTRLAACVLLTTPRVFFVLEQGWSEPIAVLLLGATVFCLVRKPACAPWLGGLLVVTKQYLTLAAFPLWRYAARAHRDTRPFIVRAAVAGLAVTLPFALWHPSPFFNSVIRLQTLEPFRTDSLSYLSWAARAGWGAGSFVWSISAALVALTAAMIRTPNTPGGFAASLSLSLLAMFAFGSKAFCNYYFFVIGALCCAVAALSASSPDLRAGDSSLQPRREAVIESPDPAPGTTPIGSLVRVTPAS